MFEYGQCLHAIPVSVGDPGSANPFYGMSLDQSPTASSYGLSDRNVIRVLIVTALPMLLTVSLALSFLFLPPLCLSLFLSLICAITHSKSKACGCVVITRHKQSKEPMMKLQNHNLVLS